MAFTAMCIIVILFGGLILFVFGDVFECKISEGCEMMIKLNCQFDSLQGCSRNL